MGLSNEERAEKTVWAIHNLVRLGRELREEVKSERVPYTQRGGVTRLANLTTGLWHAYLGTQSNSGFWLMGGDHNNPVRETNTAWEVAICHLMSSPSILEELDRRKANRGEVDPWKYLSISGLLSGYESNVYDLYSWIGQLSYALRRYPDEFLARFPDLHKSISDMQGECFGIFKDSENFGKAYLTQRLCRYVYGGYGDDLEKVLSGSYFHYKLGRAVSPEVSIAQLQHWDQWRLRNHNTVQNRLTLALRMAGHRFSERDTTKLLSLLKEAEIEVDEDLLRAEIAKLPETKPAEKKPDRDYAAQWRWQELFIIHRSFDSDDWAEEDEWDEPFNPNAGQDGYIGPEDDEEDEDEDEPSELAEVVEDSVDTAERSRPRRRSWLRAKIRSIFLIGWVQ